jgi:hypothetical protein
MSEQEVEVDEDIRALTWEVLISRDSLLKIIDRLPEENRERAEWTAARLMSLSTRLRKIVDTLPAGVAVPEDVKESVADMRLDVELALRDLDLLVKDLRLIFGEATEAGMYPLDIN